MKSLTHRERERGRELARRVRAAGIPVVEPITDEVPELLIRQDNDAYESLAFDVNGRTGLILPLKVVPNIPVFVFSGFAICLEGCPGLWFRQLARNDRGEWPHYVFDGRSELKFHRNETINRFIEQQSVFHRGYPAQGLLLAYSDDAMPSAITGGEILCGSITIVDQFEHGHSAKISLRAYREAERELKPNPLRRRLFSSPDFKPDSEDAASGLGG